MAEAVKITKPILKDETGQSMVSALQSIASAIRNSAEAKISALNDDLSAEISARQAIDAQLSAAISALNTDLSTEVSARQAIDSNLTNLMNKLDDTVYSELYESYEDMVTNVTNPVADAIYKAKLTDSLDPSKFVIKQYLYNEGGGEPTTITFSENTYALANEDSPESEAVTIEMTSQGSMTQFFQQGVYLGAIIVHNYGESTLYTETVAIGAEVFGPLINNNISTGDKFIFDTANKKVTFVRASDSAEIDISSALQVDKNDTLHFTNNNIGTIPDISGSGNYVQITPNGPFPSLDKVISYGGGSSSSFISVGVDSYDKSDVDDALAGKADKVTPAVNGNFAGLDANGNLTDSGKNSNSFEKKQFVGTTAEWNTLTSQQKAQYDIYMLTDDSSSPSFVIDEVPTENSQNLVKSGGVYQAIQQGGGGTGGHTIEDGTGTDMTARTNLQFIGASVTDDSTNNRTVVDVTGKTDKVINATNGNFAGLDSNGNLTDSGSKASDFLTSHQDITGKADKVFGATNGNLAGLDASGNLTDSGKKASDFMQKGVDYVTAGRLQNTTLGNHATAEGIGNEASGNYSHAGGYSNVVQGEAAFAEGRTNAAYGDYSHVQNQANSASGIAASASGTSTQASGRSSTTQGWGTQATRKSQTVIGEFNIPDTDGADGTVRGKYAFIVGNGTGASGAGGTSNAMTVSWEGDIEDGHGNVLNEMFWKGTSSEWTALPAATKAKYAGKPVYFTDDAGVYTGMPQPYRFTLTGTGSVVTTTFSHASVTADMRVIDSTISNPSAVLSDMTITPANGSLTVSATVNGTTEVLLIMQPCRSAIDLT